MRGTDVTNIFRLSLDTATLRRATVSYAWGGRVILRKEATDFSGNAVTVKLTPQETMAFPDDDFVRVQLVLLTGGGQTLKTQIREIFSTELLDREAIADGG